MNNNIALAVLEEHQDFSGAEPLVDVTGMSSPRVCALLNALVRRMDPEECYLEVGTWQGLTLLSAALGNFGRTCIGCDKFRLWGRYTGWGVRARLALERNIGRYRGSTADILFHAVSSRRLFAERRISSPVGVYFYDGDHSYRGTRANLVAATPFLSDRAVILVDDWNDPAIRAASFDGLGEAGLSILWHRELAGDHSRAGWWNGLAVFFVEKAPSAARLARRPPPVSSPGRRAA